MRKPRGRGWWGRVVIIQQGRVPQSRRHLVAHLQGLQGVPPVTDPLRAQRDRFGIGAHPFPDGLAAQAALQAASGVTTMHLGQHRVAQFNQMGQVRIGRKPRIQADDDRRQAAPTRVVGLQLGQPGLQLGLLRLEVVAVLGQGRELLARPRDLLLAPRLLLHRAGTGRRDALEVHLVLPCQFLELIPPYRQTLLGGLHTGVQGGQLGLHQRGAAARAHPQGLLDGRHGGAQALRRLGPPAIPLTAEQHAALRPAAQAADRGLIALRDRRIHPAKRGVGIIDAGRTDRATGQVDVDHQRLPAAQDLQHVAGQKGLADLLQRGDDGLQGGGIGGSQGATDAGIMGERQLAPAGKHGRIRAQRAGPGSEILQIVQPGQDADQELNELGLRAVVDGLLRDGDGLQEVDQAEVVGELAQQDQQGMVGDWPVGGCDRDQLGYTRGRGAEGRERGGGRRQYDPGRHQQLRPQPGAVGHNIQNRPAKASSRWYHHWESSWLGRIQVVLPSCHSWEDSWFRVVKVPMVECVWLNSPLIAQNLR